MVKRRLSKAARARIGRAARRPSISGLAALGLVALPAALTVLDPKYRSLDVKFKRAVELYTGVGQGIEIGDRMFDIKTPLLTYALPAVPLIAKKIASKTKITNGVTRGLPVQL